MPIFQVRPSLMGFSGGLIIINFVSMAPARGPKPDY